MGGSLELGAADGQGRLYVNIEDTNEVVEIDSAMLRISKIFSLKPCDEPTGMGLDSDHHRVFSGCHSKIMTVLDTTTGKVIATLPIGEKVDGNGFDAGTGLAFSANGDGTLTMVREASSGKFEVVDTITTQRGSRTMAVDPRTHRIYLPAAKFTQPKDAVQEGKQAHPVMVKDSFEVLVVGR